MLTFDAFVRSRCDETPSEFGIDAARGLEPGCAAMIERARG
jgi:hypothetical protein